MESRTLKRVHSSTPLLCGLMVLLWLGACDDPAPSPTPTTVIVTPGTAELAALQATVQLRAEVRDQNGDPMPGTPVTWSSGSAGVATVDASGLVTGVDNGTATITAAAGGVSGSASVTVAQAAVEVRVTPAADTLLALEDTVRLSAGAYDANGHAIAGAEFAWTSGDALVATVDASGLVTGVDNGTATITAAAGGASGSASVTVAQAATSIVVTPVADTLRMGDTLRLAAEATDANGNAMSGAQFAWESSDASTATVSSAGLVTGRRQGTATITATAGSAQATSEITVVLNPDRAALEALYQATGGPNWHNSRNWLSDARLDQWHGVSTDEDGRVEAIELFGNGLSGPLPPELGDLGGLRSLRFPANNLSGPIPPELGNLSKLEAMDISANGLSGPIPPELGNLGELKLLFLVANQLSGAIPPELGNLSRLEVLFLDFNRLSGAIPPELDGLSALSYLDLGYNRLSGPIPPTLGDLAALRRLRLEFNDLSGAIPPQLGDLAQLEEMYLHRNDLSGAIPAEFGGLASLQWLDISHNGLSGPIPAEMGSLVRLKEVRLGDNALSGPLPQELGGMADLESLLLDFNDLEGPVPSEFGSLGKLTVLGLAGNAGMAGALPAQLTSLRLDHLMAGGTDLCMPRKPVFEEWLRSIATRRIALCSGAMAYLTQAVQSRAHPVPLVAGKKALLRVFVTARKATTEGMPLVRARFFVDGAEVHAVEIPATSTAIPTEVDEGDLSRSANAEIPAEVVRPGLEMVVEIDPEGALDPELGVPRRIPETGRMALEAREMPLLDLTVVPFLWSEDPDSAILEAAAGMEEDPEGHELLALTHALLPVRDLVVTAHEPVVSSSANGLDLLNQTSLIRDAEGGTGYWMGTISGQTRGYAGLAQQPGRVSFAWPNPRFMAHELGHNMNLGHADCGGPARASLDPLFPNGDGSIGAWGYDLRGDGGLVAPSSPDLMSYCTDVWIGDYSFTRAAGYRWLHETESSSRAAAPARSLLLWGGVDENGDPYLNPAFVLDAPATPRESTGGHRIAGHARDDRELFSVALRMARLSEGGSAFSLVLPVRSDWAGALASVTLSGPEGEAKLDLDTDVPMAILRDPDTGRVRAILRDVPELAGAATVPSAALAGGGGLTVTFSRGIPDEDAWRR